jgi:hypothetical protein
VLSRDGKALDRVLGTVEWLLVANVVIAAIPQWPLGERSKFG